MNLLLFFKKFFRKTIFELFFPLLWRFIYLFFKESDFKTIQISIVLNCLSINAPSLTYAPSLKYPFNKGGNDLNIS